MARLFMFAGFAGLLLSAAGCPANQDAPADAGAALTACVDQPSALPRPPGSALPCELMPPR